MFVYVVIEVPYATGTTDQDEIDFIMELENAEPLVELDHDYSSGGDVLPMIENDHDYEGSSSGDDALSLMLDFIDRYRL